MWVFIIGIKLDFLCIDICWAPRGLLKSESELCLCFFFPVPIMMPKGMLPLNVTIENAPSRANTNFILTSQN